MYANKSKLAVGLREAVRANDEGRLLEIVLASDADSHVAEKVNSLGVKVTIGDTKAEIGKSINIDVACAVLGVLDETKPSISELRKMQKKNKKRNK